MAKHQTLNLQYGNHNAQYNGPVQINHYQEHPKIYCEICGGELVRGDADSAFYFLANGVHVSCWRNRQREIKSTSIENKAFPIIDQPQTLALPEPKYREVLIRDDPEKYAHLPRPFYIPLVKILIKDE